MNAPQRGHHEHIEHRCIAIDGAMLAASQSQSPVVDQPHDGDSDDVGATAAKAAPPPGTGQLVDKSA